MSPTITSWKQLQGSVRQMLDAINADQQLAKAAAVNPLFAIEELGYEIASQARQEIEDRIRFDTRQATRLRQLRRTIYEGAGHAFDLGSPEALGRVLFDELQVEHPWTDERERLDHLVPPRPQVGWWHSVDDPLEGLRGQHKLVDSLLEYRRLEASAPRLASRQLYDEVRAGTRATPLVAIHGVLRSDRSAE
jgi:DNA polymerase I-like protein with 3'-5' exonuclease and polymerase domains